ncbi:MAG: aldehyde dehydrogenase family protein, partial [Myxococcales bacterium]|nr:aldehyde dehydrogenase family protein [Myxococcales bacterium]
VGHYIDGTWVEGLESSRFDCVEPATGEVLTQVAAAGSEEVDQAVAAARKAFDGPWRRMPAAERGKVLFRVARRIQEEARQLAVLESRDNGKPIRESRDVDVPLAAAHFFYYAGWADKLAYAVPGPTPAPVGVCAQIIPWNFPLLMAAWKLAPALAAGNTCVLKPAETTPLTAMRLARILEDAGCPAGVVNIVNGAGDTGAALADHAGIHKLAFTGSTAVGRTLTRNAAGRDQRLTMELGGKGASIVFADAALDQAVEGVVDGIFFNQGQVCCAGSRLLVEESIAADFVQRLQRRMETLRVGHPLDKNTDVGAVNSAEQHARIERYLQLGRDQGATVWQGGACEPPEGGWYVRPTLLLDVQQTDMVVREEIFGPVLAVMTFRTPDEAVRKANDTEYGLAASVWTEKASKLFTVAHALRSGVVWANGANLFDPAAPFGGMRHSGFGREGGIAGLWPYLRAA